MKNPGDSPFHERSAIKRAVREHLRLMGFTKGAKGILSPPDTTKECYRRLHASRREERKRRDQAFLELNAPKLIRHFAIGTDVNPEAINPRLQLIEAGTHEAHLFRLATHFWSIPVSDGYGRRLRYLVWDQDNDKLIGIAALGDPVFNLRVRDNWIGWNSETKTENLANVMDAYVLGAVPPYNQLLGTKLIASLLRSRNVLDDFTRKYSSSTGLISKRKKNPKLQLITTSSALGRSSVYNRLKLGGQPIFESIGYTSGWGHFHIPDHLFDRMRKFLSSQGHSYASNHRFGDGPNWRLRTIRVALENLGINPRVLRHGIAREVFACQLASNATQSLSNPEIGPDFGGLQSVAEIAQLAIQRWCRPRAHRRPEFTNWTQADTIKQLQFSDLAPVTEDQSDYPQNHRSAV